MGQGIPKADWICHLCGRKNNWTQTTCTSYSCSRGWSRKHPSTHESICEKCRRPTILPLVEIVDDRGVSARWRMRSVSIQHIPRKYRDGLKLGMWVCFRCSAPDMAYPHEDASRVCVFCRHRLRATNPNLWCERCNVKTKADRDCRKCGVRLGALEFENCRKCEPERPLEVSPVPPTFLKPLSSKGMLDTNRPMKPGPGGIKSRNRAGMSLIEIKEDIERQTKMREKWKESLARNRTMLEAQLSEKEDMARLSSPVARLVLEGEAKKIHESLDLVLIRIEEVDRDLNSLKRAMSVAREVHTWRTVIPGQFDRPKRKSEVRNSTKWNPIAPVSDEDIDAERLDPIRMKPKPPFVPVQVVKEK
jgi:hypothetical protein